MKYLIHLVILIFLTSAVHAKELPIPPANEPTPAFYFKPFERQPSIPAELEEAWQRLMNIKNINWGANDSLAYAFELVYLERYEHALFYFQRLDISQVDNLDLLELYHLTLKKNQRYEKLIESYSLLKSKHPELRDIYDIRTQITEARTLNKERLWSLEHDNIFHELIDTISLGLLAVSSKKAIHPDLVALANTYDKALRLEILYSDETDKILSQAYMEYADFLHRYLYMSNAYIALNIARHFDKRNNQIPKKIKSIKKELESKNYLIPSFTVLFKKVNPEKYALKEIETIDSLQYLYETTDKFIKPEDLDQYIDKRPDLIPWLNDELLTIIVFGLMLLIILFFVDVRNKRSK